MTTPLKSVRTHPNPIDRSQVEVMSGLGTTEQHIADHLSITTEELRKHYQVQLDNGPLEANLRVARVFHELATSGDFPAMTLAWMKTRAGWSETSPTNLAPEQADKELARDKLIKLLNRGK